MVKDITNEDFWIVSFSGSFRSSCPAVSTPFVASESAFFSVFSISTLRSLHRVIEKCKKYCKVFAKQHVMLHISERKDEVCKNASQVHELLSEIRISPKRMSAIFDISIPNKNYQEIRNILLKLHRNFPDFWRTYFDKSIMQSFHLVLLPR